MALTKIGDLWIPDVWIPAIREKAATLPNILNSGIVQRSGTFDAIASGAGTSANIPLWKDISDDDDEVQVEDTAPTNTLGITAGTMVATILNRVIKYGTTALAAQLSGEDPLSEIVGQLALGRLKRRQKTLVATLRGIMGTGASAPNAAEGAVRAMRLDKFSETGAAPTAPNLIDADGIIDAIALMGELKNDLASGAILAHSTIVAALEKADKESFKEGVESGLPFTVRTYRGIPLFISDALVRNGGVSGKVFDTYIASQGVVASGEKPQVGDDIDVASLQMDKDPDKNNRYVWDRIRYTLHPNGMKWKGTPASDTASNAELAVHGNWELKFQTANRVGIVCLRTNG